MLFWGGTSSPILRFEPSFDDFLTNVFILKLEKCGSVSLSCIVDVPFEFWLEYIISVERRHLSLLNKLILGIVPFTFHPQYPFKGRSARSGSTSALTFPA